MMYRRPFFNSARDGNVGFKRNMGGRDYIRNGNYCCFSVVNIRRLVIEVIPHCLCKFHVALVTGKILAAFLSTMQPHEAFLVSILILKFQLARVSYFLFSLKTRSTIFPGSMCKIFRSSTQHTYYVFRRKRSSGHTYRAHTSTQHHACR
jgi:hypothetical protein